MDSRFEMIAATTPGREHVRRQINNQDAYAYQCSDTALVAVVCDGCGSTPHSEVGAQLGAALVANKLMKLLTLEHEPLTDQNRTEIILEIVRRSVLEHILQTARAMDSSVRTIIRDYFLFSLLGVFITSQRSCLFALGDGLFVVNGEYLQVGPYPDNSPPYLTYSLLDHNGHSFIAQQLHFQIIKFMATDSLGTLVLGTDGVLDFRKAQETEQPGKQELVGSMSQFWEDDRYFENPDRLRRKLTLMNRDSIKPDWHSRGVLRSTGLLPDDTTVMVIRRKKSRTYQGAL